MSIPQGDYAQVPSAEDWLPSHPYMRDLENHLRCTICSEFFSAPIILTTCSHTFCSACIRLSLQQDEKCPACGIRSDDSKIRKSITLEQIITAFDNARSNLLEAVKRSTSSGLNVRKRKAAQVLSDEDYRPEDPSPIASRRGSSKRSKAKVAEENPSSDIEIVSDPANPNAMVNCPICDAVMKQGLVSDHIDRGCKDCSSAGTSWKNFMSGGTASSKAQTSKRLAKSVPSSISEMRKLLQSKGLSSEGGMEVMKARYIRYVNVFNANLDLDPPRRKSLDRLRNEVQIWERAARSTKPDVSSNHAGKYSDHFSNLVNQVRSRPSVSGTGPTVSAPGGEGSSKDRSEIEDVIVPDSEEDDDVVTAAAPGDAKSHSHSPDNLPDDSIEEGVSEVEIEIQLERENLDFLKPLPTKPLPKVELPPPIPYEPTLPRPSQRERVS